MSTFKEEIEAEIAAKKAELAVLETHLASGGLWLETEIGHAWSVVKGWFVQPASAAAMPAPTSPPPAPTATP